MTRPRCPGQDMRYWRPEDIFDVPCRQCGAEIEFWKDDPVRVCDGCGALIRNPRIDFGCAKWCTFAAECAGPEDAANTRTDTATPGDISEDESKAKDPS